MLYLNLGCCDAHERGWLNVDIVEPADVIVDLTKPWPWADSSVDGIRAHDILEHLPSKIHTMNEAWRVLKHGAEFHIVVPTTDGRGAWQDPTHVSFWTPNDFWYYEYGNPHRERFKDHYGIKCAFRIVMLRHEELHDKIWKLSIVLKAVKLGL